MTPTTEISLELLKDAFRLIEKPIPTSQDGDYVEFIDENDPNSAVQFCRKNGAVFMIMTYADYKAFKDFKR